MKGNAAVKRVDPAADVGRQLQELLAQIESCFQQLERLQAEQSQVNKIQSTQDMLVASRRLSDQRKQVLVEIENVTRQCWPCFRRFDFWFPDQEKAFSGLFEDIAENLYPEPLEPERSEYPYLRALRALLLKAVAVLGCVSDEPDEQPAHSVESRLQQPQRSVGTQRLGTPPDPGSRMLNEREAAVQLGVSQQLLRKWRGDGTGPQFVKLNKCVRYESEEIERFVRTRRSATVAGAGALPTLGVQ